MWLIALLAWLLLAAPVQAQGVRLTCECPLPAGLMSTTCIGTHGLTRQPFACLNDDAKCEKCLYDQPVPDFPGRFVCAHTCPVLVGADGQPHAASCRVTSGLQPITCDNLCTYTEGFYGESTTTTTLPTALAANTLGDGSFDGVNGTSLPEPPYAGVCYCDCPPAVGHWSQCLAYVNLDDGFKCVTLCRHRNADPLPGRDEVPALPGGVGAWQPQAAPSPCPPRQGQSTRLVVRDQTHFKEDSGCWKP